MGTIRLVEGFHIQAIFQEFARIWGLQIRLKKDDQVLAQIGSMANELSALKSGVNRIGPDIFGLKKKQNGEIFELICDFSNSKLKPKRDFPKLVQLLWKTLVAHDHSKEDPLSAEVNPLNKLQRFQMNAKFPDQLCRFLLEVTMDYFGAQSGYVRLKKARQEAVSATVSDHALFSAIPTRNVVDQAIKELDVHFLDLPDKPLGIKELVCFGSNELETFASVVLADYPPSSKISIQKKLPEMMKMLVALFHSCLMETDREDQFLLQNKHVQQLKESNFEMEVDLADLEERLFRQQKLTARIESVFQIWERLQDAPRGKLFLERTLRACAHFLRSQTACICFPDMFGMHILIKSSDDPFRSMYVNELDGGLYYDLVFKREPIMWDGTDTRTFHLPSGHPKVRNCVAIPILKEDRVVMVVLVANRVDEKYFLEELQSLKHLVTLLFDPIRESFEMFLEKESAH